MSEFDTPKKIPATWVHAGIKDAFLVPRNKLKKQF